MAKHLKSYCKGETLFHEGDAGDGVYVVKTGCIAIIKSKPDGKSVILAKLQAPQMFGEMSMLSDLPRNATALALVDSRLEFWSPAYFSSLIRHDPDIALKVMQTLASRLRETDAVLAKVRGALEEMSERGISN